MISEWNDFSNFEFLYHSDASHKVSIQPDTVWTFIFFWEEMPFEEFQNGRQGGHLGYRNGTIIAILNLHVATMPPTKFQLNPTFEFGGEVENVKS